MTNVSFPAVVPQPTRSRDRDATLKHLAPKMLGIIWENGAAVFDDSSFETSPISVGVDNILTLGAYWVNEVGFGLHVYESVREQTVKVFSCHLSDPVFTVGESWKYLGGACTILSWKRGLWEERVLSQSAENRSIAHVYTAGLVRGHA